MQHPNFKINRPTITIVPLFGGKKYTYKVTAMTWKLDYFRNATFNTEPLAKKAMNNFKVQYNKAADRLEAMGRRQNIMAGEVAVGKFYDKESQGEELSDATY